MLTVICEKQNSFLGFLWLTRAFENLKSVPCRRRQQVLPNVWCLSTNFQGDTFQDLSYEFMQSLPQAAFRPKTDASKIRLTFGFILIFSINIYLCSRNDRLRKQYDKFLMGNLGYRSLPTQVLNTSTYIAVVVFRVGLRWKEKAVTASFLPLP